jgi:hypothetical protein
LNINLDINNKIQDCKISAMWGVLVGGKMKRGDKGEGIWLVSFIYIHEIE